MALTYVGDRVIVFAHWHSFRGERGRVTQVRPLMVLIDGDRLPMRIEEQAIVREQASELTLTGAE